MKPIVKTHLDVARAHLDCIELELSKPAQISMTAERFIARHAGPSINVRTSVPLMALGGRDFEHRKYMARKAGVNLGIEIAKKLDFEMSQESQKARSYGMGNPFDVEYVSTVYAYTPIELTKLIDEALRIGRQSA